MIKNSTLHSFCQGLILAYNRIKYPIMPQPTDLPCRRSIRLSGFDYRQPAAYFVTLVTLNRLPWFGTIENGQRQMSSIGQITQEEWLHLPLRFHWLSLDEWVLMPNHLHGILVWNDPPPQTPDKIAHGKPATLGTVIAQYKMRVVKKVRENPKWRNIDLWQRNYYEHVIRNPKEWDQIRWYIRNNPIQMEEDTWLK